MRGGDRPQPNDVMPRAEQMVTRLEAAQGYVAIARVRRELVKILDISPWVGDEGRQELMRTFDESSAVIAAFRDGTSRELTWNDKFGLAQAIIRCAMLAQEAILENATAPPPDRGLD